MRTQNQFQLFRERRFFPYFVTQFLGAFNDNVYKVALMIIISATFAKSDPDKADFLANLCAGLFILPFFIFSATAGQLADKYEKASLIRTIKIAEVIIMSMIGLAFYLNNIYFLISILFLTGAQSAFFGPIKYSILPQHLDEHELVGGNGLVEMGTFLAILLGTILGGTLMGFEEYSKVAITATTLSIALLGWIFSLFIPRAKVFALDKNLKINWNPFTETYNTIKIAKRKKPIFLSILGISWFWAYGICFLTQMPNYTTRFLHGDESVITLMLTLFSVGIGIGSVLCEKLSGHKIEIGLVPLGAIGLSIFAADFSFAHGPVPEAEINAIQFLTTISLNNLSNYRLLIDAFLIGVFGGFYIVPLYVFIQHRSKAKERSRIIAANNILNAFFMSIATLLAIVLLKFLDISQFFLVIALLNAAIALFIFKLAPEFLMRFIVWVLIHTVYRVKFIDIENIPDEGPCVITCNHVSFLDPLVIMAACRRPIRFVMDYRIFHNPLISFVFKTAKCIPIAMEKEDPAIKEQAFETVAKALKNGEIVGIFPEGSLTSDGSIRPFKPGIERVINTTPVPVIPMALQGLWGSFFSRKYGKAMFHIPRNFFWSKITLITGKPIPAEGFSSAKLEAEIRNLRGDKE